ncbi:hypothetical protein B0J14DRAFT_562661 [Halenospora varia]|nr:hypothetical protein B0J14DRAFT_562661 [Halenospora varia]
MDKQAVNITLTALSGDVSIAERTIELNPNHLTIPIGRASKSPSKGLLGSPNNAWFDSPVMSRNHAEMCLHPITNNITIHDIGSMHGTCLNGRKLATKEPTVVNNGDELVFGAEVRRGPEVFPACAFRVNIDFVPYKYDMPINSYGSIGMLTSHLNRPANTFAFPDSSEIDDEEEYGFSDADMDGHDPSSEDDASIEMQPTVKVSAAINAIDLTLEDSPVPTSSVRIDLTGETPVENLNEARSMDQMNGRASENNTAPGPVISAFYAGNSPIVVDSEDEYGHFSSDSEDQSEIMDSEDSDSMEEDETPLDSDSDDSEDNEENDVSEEVLDAEEEHIDPIAQHEIEPIFRAMEKEVDTSDEESEFGLSEAGAAGLRALFADDAPTSMSEDSDIDLDAGSLAELGEPEAIDDLYSEEPTTNSMFSSEPSGLSHFSPLAQNPVTEATPKATAYPTTQTSSATVNLPSSTLNDSFIAARQPSPSDAALVKSAAPPRASQATQDITISHSHGQEFGRLSQTLGDKTGKHAFFEARENNKAKLSAAAEKKSEKAFEPFAVASFSLFAVEPRPDDNAQPSKAASSRPPWASANRTRTTFAGSSLPSSASNPVKFGESSNFAASGSSTVVKVDDLSIPNLTRSYEPPTTAFPPPLTPEVAPTTQFMGRIPSPEYDMTSAVKFNESKAKSVRSRLSIHDLIDVANRDQAPRKPEAKVGDKRKASEISNVNEDEVRAWASSQEASKALELVPSKMGSTSTPQQPDVATKPVNIEERPTKRMKTFLERAAYVTVGGLVASAGVFLSLVATAPDFS